MGGGTGRPAWGSGPSNNLVGGGRGQARPPPPNNNNLANVRKSRREKSQFGVEFLHFYSEGRVSLIYLRIPFMQLSCHPETVFCKQSRSTSVK